MPVPELTQPSGMPEPDPLSRLCSLTESETQQKYETAEDSDSGECEKGKLAEVAKMAEATKMAEVTQMAEVRENGELFEHVYDEPTATAPLLGMSLHFYNCSSIS
jgi:glucose-6-phosphate dehydrogenase assembly protein OpcA